MLYVRNLTHDCTEEKLKEAFAEHGIVQRVKKIKDYAFVHFEERDDAVRAMEALNGRALHGATLEVSLAKPPSDRKKKEEVLKARERRLLQQHMGAQRAGALVPVVPAPFRAVRPPMRAGASGAAPAAAPLAYAARGKQCEECEPFRPRFPAANLIRPIGTAVGALSLCLSVSQSLIWPFVFRF